MADRTLSVTKDWDDSTLPTPYVQYSGGVKSAVDITETIMGRTYAIERDHREYPMLSVVWRLSASEMETFETFWNGELSNGAAVFAIDLMYPKNSAVTPWVVKFMPEYQFEMEGSGRYMVSAQLQLITDEFNLGDRSPKLTEETVFSFVDDFEDYNNTDGSQDVAPFPTALNGGFYWDNVAWTVTLG